MDLTFDVVALDKASKTFLKMAEMVERLSDKLDKIDGRTVEAVAKVATGKAQRDLDKMWLDLDRLDRKTANATVKVDVDRSWSDTVAKIGLVQTGLKSLAMPVAIASVTPVLMGVAAAAAQSTTSLLVLPAALTAGGIAAATMATGFHGLNDALGPRGTPAQIEKVNAALAKLAPNARATVAEIRQQGPAWDSLRLDVQQRLFAGVAEQIDTLSGAYLPTLRAGLGQTASALNLSGLGIGAFVAQAAQVNDVKLIFSNTGLSMQALVPVGQDIMAMFLDITTVGSTFLPGLTTGFANLTGRARAFLDTARETGQLREWIGSGLAALGNLVAMFWNLGATVVAVFRATGISGEGFSAQLRGWSEQLRGMAESTAGQQQITTFFESLRSLATAVGPLILAVALGFVTLFNLIAPSLPGLSQGFLDLMNVAWATARIFTELAISTLPALGATLSFLAPILGPLVGLMMAGYTASKLWAAVLVVKTGAMVAYNAALWLGQAAQLAYMLVTSSATRALALYTAGQWAANVAMAANPVGIVVIAIAALVAAIVASLVYWDEITAASDAAWGWITEKATWAWETILRPLFESFMGALHNVGAAAMWLWTNAIEPVFNLIVLLGKILVAVIVTLVVAPILIALDLMGQLVNWLWQTMFAPAFSGMVFVAQWAWGIISAIWQGFVDYLVMTFGPTFQFIGAVVSTVWAGITSAIDIAWQIIQGLWNSLMAYLDGIFAPKFSWLSDFIGGIWATIGSIIDTAWNVVIKPIFDAVSFGCGVIGDAFGFVVDKLRRAWDMIHGIIRPPILFMVDLVYNKGIVPAWNWIAGIVKLPELKTVDIAFADGGIVPGLASPGRDNRLARVGSGEAIMRPEWTGAMGADYVDAANRAAKFGGAGAVKGLHERIGAPSDATAGGSRAGDTGQWRIMREIIYKAMPNAIVSSAFRSGAPGWHGSGRALDIVGRNGLSMLAINKWIAQTYPGSTELIYTPGINLFRGQGHRYNAATQADHHDHVHWAMANMGLTGSVGANASGGLLGGVVSAFDPIGFIAEKWNVVKGLLGKIGEFGGTPWGQAAGGMVKQGIEGAYNWILEKVTGWGGGDNAGSVGSGATSNEAPGIVRIISDVARSRFAAQARQAAEVGVATGIVESGLRNLNHGDRDSIGVFQQRPSQGWGSIAQIMNVTYAAGKFFSKFPGNWASREPGALAQSVQRSAFPDRYATQMGKARALVSQHGGFANGGIIDQPTFGLIGEAGAEAVVPLTNPGRAAEVMRQAGLGGTVVKNYAVHITAMKVDGADVEAAIRRMELLDGTDLHG